jgi:hypothetical protein
LSPKLNSFLYEKSIYSKYKKNRVKGYMSIKDKDEISNNLPDIFNEIMTGVLLGDGSLRLNGHHALLSIQQTDESLVNLLWSICNKYKLVSMNVNILTRINNKTGKEKKKVYYFTTLTFPYFTKFYKNWYEFDKDNVKRKKMPINLEKYLSPIAIAHWIMGDGTFDGGRHQRIIICTDCFNLSEINYLRFILLNKFKISSRVKPGKRQGKMYYRISITGENRKNFQNLVSPFIVSSLLYRIGL